MNNQNNEVKKVVAYLRKSSEDNEQGDSYKQKNSIHYQNRFIQEQKKRYNLEVVKIFQDDKTGYKAYVRDGFEKMTEYLRENKHEINGIVCSEISRLARNFGDGGQILWYMQCGIIDKIYTRTKVFTNSSNDQLMVAIEFAMSKKSSDDTGMRTIAGMKSKAHTMKHPSRKAILGYETKGPTGAKKWVIDPKNGPLMKMVFEQFSTGKYNFKEISEFAFSIGLFSQSRKSQKRKMSKNTLRNRLIDIQYTGVFYHEDEKIVGKYKPLISTTLYYKVQNVIAGNSHVKSTHMTYAYTGIVKCGLCKTNLTGNHKKGHTYYRCSKRKLPCKDAGGMNVREDRLEESLIKALSNIEINQKTWQAAKSYVVELNQPNKINLKKQIRTLNEQISYEDSSQINFGRKFSNNELSKLEYNALTNDSKQKQSVLRTTLIKCENIVHELDQLIDEFLDNIKYVTSKLKTASPENKKELIDIFCENLEWDGKKLRWDWKKPYFFIANVDKKSTLLPD